MRRRAFGKRPKRKPLDPLVRFDKWVREERMVLDESGCWLWRGSLTTHGYGQMGMSDKAVGGDGGTRVHFVVHRWVYEFLRADIPAGLDLDHLCRVRHCVNPWHLEPVTRSVNLTRGDAGDHNTPRVRCRNGHLHSPENTSFYRGHQVCKACSRDNSRRYRARKYAAAAAERYKTKDAA